MDLFSIGLTDAIHDFKYKLGLISEDLNNRGYLVQVEEYQKGSYRFLTYRFLGKELSFQTYSKIRNLLKRSITEMLLDFLIRCEGKKRARDLIEKNYHYFDDKEQKKILDYAVQLLLNADYVEAYRNRMQKKLSDYLDDDPEIILEGFIRFRLKAYADFIEEVVEEAAENYMNETEYQEFIQVLKYFVAMNTPQIETVQLVFPAGEPPVLLNGAGEKLTYCYVDFVDRKSKSEYEELVVSTLINLSPNRIVLHKGEQLFDENFIDTLKNIFPERIEICDGCALCRVE